MKNKIPKRELSRAIRSARKAAQNHKEICGLLIYNGHFIELLETRNASMKNRKFRFNENQIRTITEAVRLLRHEIVGMFHSHPVSKAVPGPGDIKGVLDNSLMLIIDCIGNEALMWKIRNGKARKMGMEIIHV